MNEAVNWIRLKDADAVAAEACRRIQRHAEQALKARGVFKLVLAGGSTPAATYRLLAATDEDWSRWRVYFGDERCLPVGDSERNDRMAADAWLDRVGLAAEHRYPMPAELGPESGAAAYQPVVAAAVPFDLVLLGLGEDGHTASLFPGHGVHEQAWVVPVHNAPKPPPERVSLGPRALAAADAALFLVAGAGKTAAVTAWRRGEALPAAMVAARLPTTVLTDVDPD